MTHKQLARTAALLCCGATLLAAQLANAEPRLTGAGAKVPFPILAAWFAQFAREPDAVRSYNRGKARVDYLATDSAAGIDDLISGSIDFAAADTPISDAQIKQIERGMVALPIIASEVVVAYNLPGADGLNLPRAVYPKIFAGSIESWNDPAIAEANPDLSLPELPITVVVRSDASSTTQTFSAHLSAIDKGFRDAVGAARSPKWPESERFVRETHNDGVAAKLVEIPGSIGYMEYGYAQLADWQQLAKLENKAGELVAPGPESGMQAVANTPLPEAALPSGAPDLRLALRDPEGEGAYPIVSLSWLLFYASGYDDEQRDAIEGLIRYLTSEAAQEQADPLGYVPLPHSLLETVRTASETIQ